MGASGSATGVMPPERSKGDVPMNQPITMPALSDTMNSGRLVRWTKKVGEPIKKGETVAEIETDKAVMDDDSRVSLVRGDHTAGVLDGTPVLLRSRCNLTDIGEKSIRV